MPILLGRGPEFPVSPPVGMLSRFKYMYNLGLLFLIPLLLGEAKDLEQLPRLEIPFLGKPVQLFGNEQGTRRGGGLRSP